MPRQLNYPSLVGHNNTQLMDSRSHKAFNYITVHYGCYCALECDFLFSGIYEERTAGLSLTMGDTGQLCLRTVYMTFGNPRLHRWYLEHNSYLKRLLVGNLILKYPIKGSMYPTFCDVHQ
jgi:hypothetical protein